jgi:hypothetical protein
MKRMAPLALFRMRNRKGWSMVKTMGGGGGTEYYDPHNALLDDCRSRGRATELILPADAGRHGEGEKSPFRLIRIAMP